MVNMSSFYDYESLLKNHLSELVILTLDFYSEATEMAIAMYDSHGYKYWCNNEKSMSPLCKRIRTIPNLWEKCEECHGRRTSHSFFNGTNAKIGMCHLGLFNISHPIFIGDVFFASLITGQKKLVKKEDESRNVLYSALDRYCQDGLIDKDSRIDLINRFEKTDVIFDFNKRHIEQLSNIELKLLNTLESIHKKVNEHISKLHLFRHELHHPIMQTRLRLEICSDKLQSFLESFNTIKNNNSECFSKLSEVNKIIQYSESSCHIFNNIIENISSTVNDHSLNIRPRHVNVINLLNTSKNFYIPLAEEKEVVVDPIDKRSVTYNYIEADPDLLSRALLNVYHNAVKYSYYGNEWEYRTIYTKCSTEDPKYFNIQVSNYGTGILRNELESGIIWQIGQRGKLSSDRERIGSGLGLPVIKKIVEAHNGSVKLFSDPKSDDLINGPYLTTIVINIPYIQNNRRK